LNIKKTTFPVFSTEKVVSFWNNETKCSYKKD
jgi:hypothetical protein